MKTLGAIIFVVVVTVTLLLGTNFMTAYACKDYIIKHRKELVFEPESGFEINKFDGIYYTDISITKSDSNSYKVIFWGNRDSWLWTWKLDKSFSVNIPYDESKGQDVTQDLAILEILKSAKNEK